MMLNDQIKQLENVLDLRDYYDIKRPTVVFFSSNFKRLTVMRYDIMCEVQQESTVKHINTSQQSLANLSQFKALSHPSNNSIFLLDGSQIFLFDN